MIRIHLVEPSSVAVAIEVKLKGAQAPAGDAPAAPIDAPLPPIDAPLDSLTAEQSAVVPTAAPTLRLRCRYKGPNVVAEWLASFKTRTTAEVIEEITIEWGGVGSVEADGALPVSRLAIAALLDQVEPAQGDQTLFLAIVDGYLTALAKASAKN